MNYVDLRNQLLTTRHFRYNTELFPALYVSLIIGNVTRDSVKITFH